MKYHTNRTRALLKAALVCLMLLAFLLAGSLRGFAVDAQPEARGPKATSTLPPPLEVNLRREARNVIITPTEVISDGLRVVPTLGQDEPLVLNYDYGEGEYFPCDFGKVLQPAFNDDLEVRAEETNIGEQWCAKVRVSDGTNFGLTVGSNCGVISPKRNTVISNPTITPTMPTEDDPLTVSYEPGNVDGSIDENQTQLRWYRDDVLQPAFNDQEQVPAEATNVGEVWHVKLRVSDGTDFGPALESNRVLISPVGNMLPMISNPRIVPSMPTASDHLTVSYGYIDPDGDQEDQTQTIIRWLRDGQLQPQFNNQRSVDARFTIPGEKWWAMIQAHDGQHYGPFDTTPPVHISEGDSKNTPPEVINVQIRPAEPSAGQDLRLTYEFSDPDEDAEQGTIIRWYRWDSSSQHSQHMSKYDNLTVLPATETAPSEVWYAVVIPSDGQDYGRDVPAPSVTIGQANSPPEARNVLLAPAIPGDDQDLVISYEYYDKNDDPEGATEIKWTINGSEKPALPYLNRTRISGAATIVGQEWCAQVTPHDGNQPGEPVHSNCVTIAKVGTDTVPTISDVYILPAVPRSRDNLTLHYTYTDPDNDPEADTIIRWYRNGKPFNSVYDNQTAIPASETSPGDVWTATVRPRDRSGTTGKMKSSPLIIINTAPQVVTVAMDPQEPVTSQDLSVSYEYEDQDNHPQSDPRITWHKNGMEQPQFENQSIIPASETSGGERWQATIYAFDGYEYSQKLRTTEIQIPYRLYLPLIITGQTPNQPDQPTPTASPTNTPTPTPSPTPTPAPFEPNNSSQEAYGPLVFGQIYEAYPEDQNDWYYIILDETTSLELIVKNYTPAPGGQLIVYQEYFDTHNQPQRRLIAHDGRQQPNMQIPNELNPNALKELPPGKYLIRIYTVANQSSDTLYQLQSNKK
ncbi:MAG: hypothetical protein ACPGWR_05380 [Ardenticatenaceae bacterium]